MKRTTDMFMAAWLGVEKGIEFDDYNRLDRRRVEYLYEITDEQWKKLKMGFYKSIVSKVKVEIERLKDVKY